jgi:hypothetical protein
LRAKKKKQTPEIKICAKVQLQQKRENNKIEVIHKSTSQIMYGFFLFETAVSSNLLSKNKSDNVAEVLPYKFEAEHNVSCQSVSIFYHKFF